MEKQTLIFPDYIMVFLKMQEPFQILCGPFAKAFLRNRPGWSI